MPTQDDAVRTGLVLVDARPPTGNPGGRWGTPTLCDLYQKATYVPKDVQDSLFPLPPIPSRIPPVPPSYWTTPERLSEELRLHREAFDRWQKLAEPWAAYRALREQRALKTVALHKRIEWELRDVDRRHTQQKNAEAKAAADAAYAAYLAERSAARAAERTRKGAEAPALRAKKALEQQKRKAERRQEAERKRKAEAAIDAAIWAPSTVDFLEVSNGRRRRTLSELEGGE